MKNLKHSMTIILAALTVAASVVITTLADGYKHIETVKENRKPIASRPVSAKKNFAKSKFEIELEKIKERRRAALSKTNEVSITVGR